jgi:hypothetical protein
LLAQPWRRNPKRQRKHAKKRKREKAIAKRKHEAKQLEHDKEKAFKRIRDYTIRLTAEIVRYTNNHKVAMAFGHYMQKQAVYYLDLILNNDYEAFKFIILCSEDAPYKFHQPDIFTPAQVQQIINRLKNEYGLEGAEILIYTKGTASIEEDFLERISNRRLTKGDMTVSRRLGIIPNEWEIPLVPETPWTPLVIAQQVFNLTKDELIERVVTRRPN